MLVWKKNERRDDWFAKIYIFFLIVLQSCQNLFIEAKMWYLWSFDARDTECLFEEFSAYKYKKWKAVLEGGRVV